jgi:hypothetical protein
MPLPTFSALHLFREAAREFVVHAVLHVDAVGADAGLAGVAVFRGDGAFDRGVEVGVVEHDEGGVAAQFQRQLLDRRRALLHQQAADRGRARKAQLAHGRIRAHLGADRLRIADHHREHALRHAGAFRQHGQGQGGVGRQLGGLQHDRAAGGQGRGHLAGDHRGREVPRRDGGADADRLLGHDQAAVARRRFQHVAFDALGLLAKPFEEGGGVADFAFGFRQRLALFGGHDGGQVVRVFQHQVVPLAQDEGAFARGLLAPGRPGGVRGRYRAAGFLRAHVRHGAQRFAGGRIGHGHGLAFDGIAPVAVDIRLLAQQGRIFQVQHGFLVLVRLRRQRYHAAADRVCRRP